MAAVIATELLYAQRERQTKMEVGQKCARFSTGGVVYLYLLHFIVALRSSPMETWVTILQKTSCNRKAV